MTMKAITSSIYSFEKLRQEGYLYVDKTEYIWKLIMPAGSSYFLSRPRRFGKSLTLSTLKAIFQGKKELFKGLAIYDKPYDWKQYPVIHLDMNGFNFNSLDEFESSLLRLMKETADEHGVHLTETTPSNMFREIMTELSRQQHIVLLLDEYDKPILNNIGIPDAQRILAGLKAFYSVIKAFEGKLRFAFITGVSKFCHVSLFSDLNNLTDITMDARFATMLGYTQEELEANFADRIEALAPDGDEDAFKAEIKEWYNGYRFEENANTVYNPVSLAQFFDNGGKFNNYWFATGTPTFLLELTKRKNFDFQAAMKKPIPEIAFSAFEIDDIDPLALLLQTGYMTIRDAEQKMGRTWYWLDFPNREVAEAFGACILSSYAGKNRVNSVQFVAEFTQALMDGDTKQLRKALEVFCAGIPYDTHKKHESTFQTIFFSIFRLVGIYIEAESATNDGRIDAVALTDDAIYVFEFKLDNDPTALAQIKEKEYYKKYLLDKRDIVLVGVNFDATKGNPVGWQEERFPLDQRS